MSRRSWRSFWLQPRRRTIRKAARRTTRLAVLLLEDRVTPSGGTWTATGSLNNARQQDTVTLLPSGLVLVAGGDNFSGLLASAELYNPTTGTWTATGSLNNARGLDTATLLPSGLVLVAGGEGNSGLLTSAELYNPTTGTWTATGSLHNARDYATATLLPSGLVLVAGGEGNNGYLASAELYNPTTGAWTATGSLNTARGDDTATLLPSGLVLVAGGYGNSGQLASAELYNPTTGTWTATGSLNTARDYATATLLPSGLVLVAGGDDNSGPLASAELYTPPVSQAPTSVAVASSSSGTSIYGTADTFTATVTATSGGAPVTSGNVQFYADGTAIGSAVAVNGSGVATSPSLSTLQVTGSPHVITADYLGVAGTYATSNGTLAGGETITPLTLSVIGITANNKPYDGTTTATAQLKLGSAALSGVISPDIVSLITASAVGTFNFADVNTATTVTISGLALGGSQASDYALPTIEDTTPAGITPVAATIVVTGYSGNYTASPHGVVSSSATGVVGAAISGLSVASTTFTDVPGGSVGWTFSNVDYIGQSGSASVTINPVAATIAVTGYSGGPYDGNSHTQTVTVTGVGSDGTLYTTSLSGTNANSYSQAWSFSNGNYKPIGESGTLAFTINQVGSTVAVTWGGTSTPYDGNHHSATASWTSTGTDGAGGLLTVSYVGINGTSYSSTTAPTNAGQYQASATYAGDTNHTGNTNSASFTISQASATVVYSGYTGGPYDGSQHTQTVTITGVGSDGTLYTTSLSGTNANSYSQAWSFSNGNYKPVGESGTLAFTINQVGSAVAVTWGGTSTPYDGNSHGATASWSSTGADGQHGTLSVSYYASTDLIDALPGAPSSAGSYVAVATYLGDTNHTGNTNSASFTISQASATVVYSGYTGGPYDGSQHTQTVTITGVGSDGTLYTTSLSGTNANSYSQAWSFSNGNYKPVGESGTLSFTIGQAGSMTSVSDAGGTADGITSFPATASTNTTDGLTPTPNLDYHDNTTSTDLVGNAPVSAGNYTVTATYAGDANHDGSSAMANFNVYIVADPGYYAPVGSVVEYEDPAGTWSAAGATAATTDLPGTYSAAGAASPTEASLGYFVADSGASSETAAPVGYYVPNPGATAATEAGPGYFVASTGQSAETAAPVGYYVSGYGATAATEADPGYFVATTGQSSETAASVGYYVPAAGATAATEASPGYFVASTGQSSETPASPGFYVPTSGASSATPASPGYYVPGSAATSEIEDLAGTFSGAGATAATTDSAGTYSAAGAAAATPASPGYYVPSAGASSETPAAPGSYVPTSGATSATPASPGYYVPGSAATSEIEDSAGTFSGAGATMATTDSAGTYSAAGAAAATPASPGYYVATAGASSETPAAPGSYVPTSGATSASPADAGYFVASTGQSSETPASPGSYVPTSGASSATPASPGYYVPGSAATSEIEDPLGTYSGSGAAAATPFPAGTLGNLNQTYGGAPESATATIIGLGTSSFTFTYNGSATAPTAAGSYTVVATLVNANDAGSLTGTLHIAQAPSSTTVVDAGGTYNGTTAFPATAAGATGAGGLNDTTLSDFTFSYVGTGSTVYAASPNAPVNAGTYTVTATYAGDTNHTGNTNCATFTICQANATVVYSGYTGGPYDGNQHTQAVTVTGVGGDGTLYTTSLSGTNANSYSQAWSFSNGNYKPVGESGTLAFTISQVGSTVAVTWGGTSTPYDGNHHSATASWTSTGTDGAGGLLTVSYVGINGTVYAYSTTAPTNAGQYQASATYAGDTNHTGNTSSATFTIGQASATVVYSGYTGGPYDGHPHTQTVTVTGVGSDGTLYATSLSGTNAASYSQAWSFSNGNYKPVGESGTLAFTINQVGSTGSVTWTDGTSTTYDGNHHGATASWTSTGTDGAGGLLTVSYVGINGTVYASSTTAPTNAGQYAASASFVGDTNHTGNSHVADFTINKASSATTTVGAGPFTYTGSAQLGGSGTVSGAGGLSTSATSLTYSANANGTGTADFTDAGTYYVTAHYAGDANHTASDGVPVAILINPAEASIAGDVYVLNQKASGALTVSGNAGLNVAGTLQVDSNSASAVVLSGNAEVQAAQTLLVGGDQISGNASLKTTTLMTHDAAASVADPLSVLAAQTGTGGTAVNLSGNQTQMLSPGTYASIMVSGNAKLILMPGIYIVGSGGITVSGNATVTSQGQNVLLYNNGALTVSGNASVNLTAYSSGDYAGLAVFQASNNTSAVTVSGNANLNLNGAFLYAANVQSMVTISGSAQVEASLVVNELNISGNFEDTAL